ncbi:RagB/SusD family nutrient uptake outer membrane protein [Gynurincola endophyticus]|uniref:RagB/SusD family nutrient uptake outer membrane protein n=1 Tax=Gynurincola endophyticus TaxID=2479004 RepID=UPI000F8EEFD9|nr:RagB/SusD family nutrient uptake outer membrane protein [Gynurincola endophyticus]
MKRYIYILTISFFVVVLNGCNKDFLDVRKINADITIEQMYTNYSYAQSALWNVYSYLPDGFANLHMEAATDNAESTSPGAGSQAFNMGIWNQYTNPDNIWTRNFEAIQNANLFLKNMHKIDIDYIKNGIVGVDSSAYYNARDNVKYMKGEVLFLKAFFYFELVKRYGAVPIFEEAMVYEDESTWKNAQRNSLDECIRYIAALCDEASGIIPAVLNASWYEDGRITHGAIRALKSQVLLYGASPLYRAAGSTITWADAASAAYAVINMNRYALDASYSKLFGPDNANTQELIFYKRYGALNWMEQNNFPIVFENSNGNSITPSQNFVDQFEVLIKDGSGNVTESVPFNWSDAVHAVNPYQNRDPRLQYTVITNNATFKATTIETFTGGNSGLPKLNATKTGYYLSKWVNPSIDLVNGTTSNHNWVYFRYAEILLNYAEAMFNAYGATADPGNFGMTALSAVNTVRQRVGMPALNSSQLNQEAIERERNVELGFENKRFWDARRWDKATTYFKTPLNRIVIQKTGTGTFTYNVIKLEDRIFHEKMNWYPIPQTEINITQWTQNPGWE